MDNRNVFSGDTFRIEISGNKAKRKEITIPKINPCPIAFHETGVCIVIGRKSCKTSGKNCCIMVPAIAPITEPIKPMMTI